MKIKVFLCAFVESACHINARELALQNATDDRMKLHFREAEKIISKMLFSQFLFYTHTLAIALI